MSLMTREIEPDSMRLDAKAIDARCEALQLLIQEARLRQRRRQRWIGGALSAVVAIAGVVYAIASGAAIPRSPGTTAQPAGLVAYPSCAMTALHPSIVGPPNGAAGTIYYTLKLVNSATTCTVAPLAVRGYDKATTSFVGPWSYVESTSKVKAVVTHGHAAYVNLGVTETGNYPKARCKAANVKNLSVATSQNRSSLQIVNLAVSVCTATKSLLTQSPTLSRTP